MFFAILIVQRLIDGFFQEKPKGIILDSCQPEVTEKTFQQNKTIEGEPTRK